jgi:hypothetical protein
VRTVARLVVAAAADYIAKHRPYDYGYSGTARDPVDDVDFIIGWYARELLPGSGYNDNATEEALFNIFPDLRDF